MLVASFMAFASRRTASASMVTLTSITLADDIVRFVVCAERCVAVEPAVPR